MTNYFSSSIQIRAAVIVLRNMGFCSFICKLFYFYYVEKGNKVMNLDNNLSLAGCVFVWMCVCVYLFFKNYFSSSIQIRAAVIIDIITITYIAITSLMST